MKTVETLVEIAAPASRVWDILTDFPSHAQWNPFVRSISGPMQVGKKLSIFVQPPSGKGMRFNPTVLVAQPQRELRWKGRLFMPGLFDGEHYLRLAERDGRTRLEHGERFSGLLVMLMPASSFENIKAGFHAMNQALKARAEN